MHLNWSLGRSHDNLNRYALLSSISITNIYFVENTEEGWEYREQGYFFA